MTPPERAGRRETAETDPTSAARSNVLDVTVGELSGALKRAIEERFGYVRVRGEISNYRGPHSSGHAYFCLKDETARIDAVVWKTAFARLKTKPQEGLEVVATGRITTFPGKSTYQIVIDAIEPAGVGALMAILEERRKALAAEGLFDESRKRALPFLPRTVGVVTSPTGAVIRDILHRIEDRFPVHVVVWPVRVQGETAAAEVAAAIAGFDALPRDGAVGRPDVLIVARGGGSLEDLWAFNEEPVLRAAAACSIPLISAVGHETDWTLLDHVADLRAPTPSGAAEKVVPVRADLILQHADLASRHRGAALRLIDRRRHELRSLARALPSAETIVAIPRQRLDRAEERLRAAAKSARDRRHLDLARLTQRLTRQSPSARLAQMQHRLAATEQRLTYCIARATERRKERAAQGAQRLQRSAVALQRDIRRAGDAHLRLATALRHAWSARSERRRVELERCGRLLETLGYRQVLARGFALVRDADGRPLRSAYAVIPTTALDIEFHDGHIEAVAAGTRRARLPRTATKPKTEQGSLF